MTIYSIAPNQLGRAIKAHAKLTRAEIRKAAVEATHRFRAHMVDVVDKSGINDTGAYRNGFKVAKNRDGAVMFNDAPHAPIIERGARPHRVGQRVVDLIARWARRKLKVKPKDAIRIAWAIAQNIAARGSKAHYLVRDNLPAAAAYFKEAVRRRVRDATRGAAANRQSWKAKP